MYAEDLIVCSLYVGLYMSQLCQSHTCGEGVVSPIHVEREATLSDGQPLNCKQNNSCLLAESLCKKSLCKQQITGFYKLKFFYQSEFCSS